MFAARIRGTSRIIIIAFSLTTLSMQIAYHFDPISVYNAMLTRANKTRDVSAAFLAAIEADRHMPEMKASLAIDKVRVYTLSLF